MPAAPIFKSLSNQTSLTRANTAQTFFPKNSKQVLLLKETSQNWDTSKINRMHYDHGLVKHHAYGRHWSALRVEWWNRYDNFSNFFYNFCLLHIFLFVSVVMCHVSGVKCLPCFMCFVSHVRCQMSCVACYLLPVTCSYVQEVCLQRTKNLNIISLCLHSIFSPFWAKIANYYSL